MKLQTIILIGFSFFTLLYSVRMKVKPGRNELLLALFLGAAYLFYLIWLPLTEPEYKAEIYSFLERKISFFVFPFTLLYFNKLSTVSYRPLLIWFLYGTVFTALFANGMIMFHFLYTNQYEIIHHVNYRLAFEQFTHIHPTYFGMYICFSFVILFSKQNSWIQSSNIKKIALSMVLLIALLLLFPKAAIITWLILVIYFLLFEISISIIKRLQILAAIALIVTLSYLYLPLVSERMNEVFSFLNPVQNNLTSNSMMIRNIIFKSDLILLEKYWLFGLGPVALQQHLNVLLYTTSFFAGHNLGTYNTHNEFLNQWLSFGLAGFIYFLVVLIIQFRKAISKNDLIYLMLLIILTITFLTENILSRQQGVVFYALFTSLFYFERRNFDTKL